MSLNNDIETPPTTFDPEGSADIHDEHENDPWVFLHDVGEWVKVSMLHVWRALSPHANSLLAHQERMAAASARSPIHERPEQPETTAITAFTVGTQSQKVAGRDRLRKTVLVKNMSNVTGPNIAAASNSLVYVSNTPIPQPGLGPNVDLIPAGGSQTYEGTGSLHVCADAAGTLVIVTVERWRHDKESEDRYGEEIG